MFDYRSSATLAANFQVICADVTELNVPPGDVTIGHRLQNDRPVSRDFAFASTSSQQVR
jgi:hypothetical protein